MICKTGRVDKVLADRVAVVSSWAAKLGARVLAQNNKKTNADKMSRRTGLPFSIDLLGTMEFRVGFSQSAT